MRNRLLAVVAALTLAGCTQAGDDADEPTQDPSPAAEEGTGPAADQQDPLEPPDDAPDEEPPVGAAPGGDQPEWAGPPENEIGAVVALDPIVLEGESAAVAVTALTVYSTGVQLAVAVRLDPGAAEEGAGPPEDPMGSMGGPPPTPDEDGELPDEVLRIGVVHPDGSTASTLEEPESQGEPEGPLLQRQTSAGTGSAWDYQLWLWPSPEPDGQPLEIVVEWPEQGIDSRAEVDGEQLAAATDSVVELWPAEG